MANPESDSLANLQKDIEAVKEQGYTYKMCELPEASQVQYFTKDGKIWRRWKCVLRSTPATI